jgi:LuxR family maltose regulon positive regulatory protein
MSQAPEFSPILRTKLYRPEITGAFVDRPHLLEQLDSRRRRRLTLVSAAAGYGKTTLISSWLESSEQPWAWLSLDERDDDLVTFLTYFIAAIHTIYPAACRETLALLNAANLPPLDVFSRSLINELDQLEPAFTLVLDDLHFITDVAIHDLLTELLRYPPQPLHLVIITRRDPSLPITTLRARDQVTEIRPRDLRFTAAETAALLQQMQGIALDQSTAANLTKKTEGWVTALRLSILALRRQGDLKRLLKSLPKNLHLYVADYLMAEVFAGQSPAIQEFLLKTSILDWLNGPLCDVVAGLDDNGQAYLESLHKANLFILPLSDQQESYRYHHLFQAYLQSQLEHRYRAADIAALHTRASSWFAQAGFVNEALRHALAAGDTLGAAQLVEKHRHALLDREGGFTILRKWLAMIPDEVVRQRPSLLLAQAWVLHYQFNLRAIPPILQSATALLDNGRAGQSQPIEMSLSAEIDCFRAIIAYWQGQHQRCMERLHHALPHVPTQYPFFRGFVATYLAFASQAAGQKEMGLQVLYENRPPGQLPFGAIVIHLLSAELTEAAQVAQHGLTVTAEKNHNNLTAWTHYCLGCVYYERNDLKMAVNHLAQAVDLRHLIVQRGAIESMVGLTLAYQANRQQDEAEQLMKLLLEFSLQTNNPAYVAVVRSFQARLSLLQGDLASAMGWLQTADLSTDVGPMFIWLEVPRLTECRVLIARGSAQDLQAAVGNLQAYLQAAEANHNTLQMIHILNLQALAYQAQSKTDEALTSLERAVILARPGGFIRAFVDCGPSMAELLAELTDRDVALAYTRQILAAFPASGFGTQSPSPFPSQSLPNPLTQRELQTLRLLATDNSMAEIAAEMVVSINTVRTHAKHIYSKLDVNSRTKAVHRANELGLL